MRTLSRFPYTEPGFPPLPRLYTLHLSYTAALPSEGPLPPLLSLLLLLLPLLHRRLPQTLTGHSRWRPSNLNRAAQSHAAAGETGETSASPVSVAVPRPPGRDGDITPPPAVTRRCRPSFPRRDASQKWTRGMHQRHSSPRGHPSSGAADVLGLTRGRHQRASVRWHTLCPS